MNILIPVIYEPLKLIFHLGRRAKRTNTFPPHCSDIALHLQYCPHLSSIERQRVYEMISICEMGWFFLQWKAMIQLWTCIVVIQEWVLLLRGKSFSLEVLLLHCLTISVE